MAVSVTGSIPSLPAIRFCSSAVSGRNSSPLSLSIFFIRALLSCHRAGQGGRPFRRGMPFGGIGVIGTLGRLRIEVPLVLDVGPAVDADVAEFTVFADVDLVLVDRPEGGEVAVGEGAVQRGLARVAE